MNPENDSNGLPIIDMSSYKSMDLLHLVFMNTGEELKGYGGHTVKVELLHITMHLPDLAKAFSEDKDSISNVWIDMNLGNHGYYETDFQVQQNTNVCGCS